MAGRRTCTCCGCDSDYCPRLFSTCYKIKGFNAVNFPTTDSMFSGGTAYPGSSTTPRWTGRFVQGSGEGATIDTCGGTFGWSPWTQNTTVNKSWGIVAPINDYQFFATLHYLPKGHRLGTDNCTWEIRVRGVTGSALVVYQRTGGPGRPEPTGKFTRMTGPASWPTTIKLVRDDECLGVHAGVISISPTSTAIDNRAQTFAPTALTLTRTRNCTWQARIIRHGIPDTGLETVIDYDWLQVYPRMPTQTVDIFENWAGGPPPATIDDTTISFQSLANTTGVTRVGFVVFELICGSTVASSVRLQVTQDHQAYCTAPTTGTLPASFTLTLAGITSCSGGAANGAVTLTKSGTTYADAGNLWSMTYFSGKWFLSWQGGGDYIEFTAAADLYTCEPLTGALTVSDNECIDAAGVTGSLS